MSKKSTKNMNNGKPNKPNQTREDKPNGRKPNGRGSTQDRDKSGQNRNASVKKPHSPLIKDSSIQPGMLNTHNHYEYKLDTRGILDHASTYGFYYPNGKSFIPTTYLTKGAIDSKIGVPTVMACEYVPIPGYSDSATSAISIAAQQLFQHIRAALNKPLAGYQFADPVIAYQCFLSLVIQAQEMIRDVRVMNTWSTDNYAWPEQVMYAMGYDYGSIRDLRKNMANYIMEFDMAMYEASAIFLPMETDAVKKFTDMCANIWTDHASPKSQLYLYTTAGYYKFEETESQGSKAKFYKYDYEDRRHQPELFGVKLQHFRDCVEALRNSDSYNLLMSDLRTAYDGVKGYVFQSMPVGTGMQLSYSDIMLRQWQNTRTIPPCNLAGAYLDVTQNVPTNTLVIKPTIPAVADDEHKQGQAYNLIEKSVFPNGVLMNFSTTRPDNREVVDNLDGVTLWHYDVDTKKFEFYEGDYCWYIPLNFRMYYPTSDSSGNNHLENTALTSWEIQRAGDPWNYATFSILAFYDWHPIIEVGEYEPDMSAGKPSTATSITLVPLVDDENMSIMTTQQIRGVNKAAQLGIWKIDTNI